MRIAMSADHRGAAAAKQVAERLKSEGHTIELVGEVGGQVVDYPEPAWHVGKAVADGRADLGLLICGTGIGMSIAANKIKGIRAAHVESVFTAQMSAEHNAANVLCIGERVTGTAHALMMVRAWLNAKFEARHQKRVDKIMKLEG